MSAHDFTLPLLVSPQTLHPHLHRQSLLVVDLGKPGIYAQAHVPGAIHVDHRRLQHGEPPAPGALPDVARLNALFSDIGLTPATQLVAYDDEGGVRAARLLWVLEAIGHTRYSLLDGGIHAWLADELPYDTEASLPQPGAYRIAALNHDVAVDVDELLARHRDPGVVVWDARSREEFDGARVTARHAGHIPGAVHYEWSRAIDEARDLRLRDLGMVRAELAEIGITPDKHIVTHCQTHQRSSFTWLLGRLLGFRHIRGYPGAWAEWGNRDDTPVSRDS